MNRLRRRATALAFRVRSHPLGSAARRASGRAATVVWRALPRPVRAGLNRLRVRPGLRPVSLDRCLLGDENGIEAARYAEISGDLLRPSTPIERWPHTLLLDAYRATGAEALTPEGLRESPYVVNGRRCIELTGHYFGATSEDELYEQARAYVAWALEGAPPTARPSASGPRSPVRVRRVRASDCFQVVDGHHRLATARSRGEVEAQVAVEWRPVWTPLQRVLRDMSWLEGQFELYQPVPAPELASRWVLVRRCTDRLAKMSAFLAARGLLPPATRTYLDVACAYGWFVAQMAALGYDARGVERDPRSRIVADHVYGLDPGVVSIGDCVSVLERTAPADVVSCLSLLHHFVLGRGACSPERLVELLDRAAGRVLFIDTGQAHESMLGPGLEEWDTDFVHEWLRRHTTFDEIVRLGPDEDGVGPFAGNYGRMLFACVRREPAVSRPGGGPGGS